MKRIGIIVIAIIMVTGCGGIKESEFIGTSWKSDRGIIITLEKNNKAHERIKSEYTGEYIDGQYEFSWEYKDGEIKYYNYKGINVSNFTYYKESDTMIEDYNGVKTTYERYKGLEK